MNNPTFEGAIVFDKFHPSIIACEFDLQRSFDLARSYSFRRYVGPLGSILIGSSLSGLQIYKVCDKVLEFLVEYKLLVSDSNSWFASQEALSILYLKYRDKISFSIIKETEIGMDNFITSQPVVIYRKKDRESLYDDYVLHSNPIFHNLGQEYLGQHNPLLPSNNLNHKLLKNIYLKLIRLIPLFLRQVFFWSICKLFILSYSEMIFAKNFNIDKLKILNINLRSPNNIQQQEVFTRVFSLMKYLYSLVLK